MALTSESDLDALAAMAYNLNDPDSVYECAYGIAYNLERMGAMNYMQHREYPFEKGRAYADVRLAWDMGFEDGKGDGSVKYGC